MRQYKHLVYAGTFDHLHIGHRKMLERAFELAEQVAIGITDDEMVKGKAFGESIEKIEDRRWKVEKYLKENGFFKRAKIFVLHDIYGPAIENNSYDAILVTEATKKNAEKINTVRVMRNLRKLRVAVEPMVMADDGKPVTSERIRAGEIDRNGKQYQISNIKNQKYLKLPEYLREELRKPLGKVIKSQIPSASRRTKNQTLNQNKFGSGQANPNPPAGGQIPNEEILKETARKVLKSVKSTMLITVGDIVTMSLLKVGFTPHISIVDLRSRRKPIKENLSRLLPSLYGRDNLVTVGTSNAAGAIDLQAVTMIQSTIKSFFHKKLKYLIKVKGEEDLLALPAILFAPLGSVVLYGQMDVGVVMVEVTEEKKKEVREIIEKFR